jgi:hypothetical protein
MRVMVASAAGLAATGVLEANRLLLAPVLLSVQGVGAAILVHYSRVVSNDLPRTLRAADRDALTLTFAACGGTLVLVAAAPVLGDVVLGSTALVDRLVMLGWGLVAVGIGATLPYGTLTAVAGAPHRIVVIRTVDVVVSLGCVGGYLALSASADAYRWAPAMVGVFLLGTALLQRRVCRRQLEQARAQESSHHESSAGQVNS